jgi:hypothetical protein
MRAGWNKLEDRAIGYALGQPRQIRESRSPTQREFGTVLNVTTCPIQAGNCLPVPTLVAPAIQQLMETIATGGVLDLHAGRGVAGLGPHIRRHGDF